MVGSEHLARVIGHADEAGAKLVLVGDPEQLGAIEAGGLFSAIAERTEPVHLRRSDPPQPRARPRRGEAASAKARAGRP